MISYEQNPQQAIPESSVKIVGLGGAGSNMLEQTTLDGLSGAEMICINTDIRTLNNSFAEKNLKNIQKIQIGKNLTKGLGAGGDPEIGLKAAQEAEQEIRESFRGSKIVLICVGLGEGTGSGAAPLISRLAREEGAFVVIFATMPFTFEGNRRRNQAETALNELSVLANALVTFDNNRMGELVVAKQGIHEAFSAADKMISESVKAVTRLVIKPGIINVGLDDLMTALRTTRSRCLFGSGMANGENRTQKALENTLNSPLLDQGALLKEASTVLIHICGGDSLTLHEVELLMKGLAQHVPENAHILFGAAVDPTMGDNLSVTLVSSLPEEKLIFQEKKEEEVTTEEEEETQPDHEEINEIQEETTSLSEEHSNTSDNKTNDQLESDETGLEDNEHHSNLDSDPEEIISEESEDVTLLDEASESPDEIEEEEEKTENNETYSEEETISEESSGVQVELKLDSEPRGKFEGEDPNEVGGENLDIPAFLRKSKS